MIITDDDLSGKKIWQLFIYCAVRWWSWLLNKKVAGKIMLTTIVANHGQYADSRPCSLTFMSFFNNKFMWRKVTIIKSQTRKGWAGAVKFLKIDLCSGTLILFYNIILIINLLSFILQEHLTVKTPNYLWVYLVNLK